MKRSDALGLSALAGAYLCLAGCSGGKAPFRQVQFCLAGPQEIPSFTNFMNEIAQEYRMEFTDRSGQTQEELRALKASEKYTPINDRAVNISAVRGSEFSFGASNLGLPTQQVVIGFNGDSHEKATAFANATVERLSTRWHIHEVHQGQGAFPLATCN